jgi:transcriptional regulator with XRE-family HTH domain
MRDSIAWLYGSGFPKSLDISKAIDKNNGKSDIDLAPFGNYVKEQREAKGWSRSNLDDLMGTNTAVSWWEGRASGVQLPSKEIYTRLKEVLEMDNRFDYLIDWAEAEREVIGSKMSGIANKEEKDRHTIGASKAVEVDITAPATPEAQQWQGWGTALKPAFEPVVVARKPLGEKTVAANVLAYGTGGLNIDASRIGTEKISTHDAPKGTFAGGEQDRGSDTSTYKEHTGRWPANIILDPYTAELLDEQSGISKDGIAVNRNRNAEDKSGGFEGGWNKPTNDSGFTGSGGASRFFYVAKASKKDRNEGLNHLEARRASGLGYDIGLGAAGEGMFKDRNPQKENFHPTVKPTALMEYLIKLVTPEGGVVLDPFTGSGSTGKAALLNGYQFIGIELTDEYLPIIEGRLKWANEQANQKEEEKNEVLF